MPFDGCGSRRRCPPTARELAASNGPSGAQNIENTVQANPAMTPRTHLHPSRWDRDAPIRHLAPAPGRPTSKTPHGSRSLSIWSDRASCLGGKGPWGHVPPAGRRERPAQIGHPRHNDRKDNRLGPPRLSSAPPSHPACRPLPTRLSFQGLVSRTAKIQLQEVGGVKTLGSRSGPPSHVYGTSPREALAAALAL